MNLIRHSVGVIFPLLLCIARAAVRTWQVYSKKWEAYCTDQSEPLVRPILVVQVQDATGKQLSNCGSTACCHWRYCYG